MPNPASKDARKADQDAATGSKDAGCGAYLGLEVNPTSFLPHIRLQRLTRKNWTREPNLKQETAKNCHHSSNPQMRPKKEQENPSMD